jgi:hypothetical protein
MKIDEQLSMAGLEIVPHIVKGKRYFVLRDDVTGKFRTCRSLDSKFAWARHAAVAARFASRKIAGQVAQAYANGVDRAKELAAGHPPPEDYYYPPVCAHA